MKVCRRFRLVSAVESSIHTAIIAQSAWYGFAVCVQQSDTVELAPNHFKLTTFVCIVKCDGSLRCDRDVRNGMKVRRAAALLANTMVVND